MCIRDRYCTAGQYGYVPLGRHFVITIIIIVVVVRVVLVVLVVIVSDHFSGPDGEVDPVCVSVSVSVTITFECKCPLT